MAWQTPKNNWQPADVVQASDLNRIEGNINAIEQGSRTIDPSQAPTGVAGNLRNFLDWFANRIKAILGTTNWYDAPPTTLTAAKSHIDAAAPHSGHATTAALTAHTSAAAPHSGHETPAGAQAKVDSALAAVLDPVTGHRHSGEAGDGPILPYDAYFAPGNVLLASHDAERYTYSKEGVRLKRFTVPYGGRFRVEWETRSSNEERSDGAPTYTYLKYAGYEQSPQVHGVPHNAWVKKTHVMTRDVAPGDTIELWGYASREERVYVRNFRLFGSPVPRTFEID